MPTLFRMLDSDAGRIIHDFADGAGELGDCYNNFGSGVRLSIPPYPIELDDVKLLQKHAPNKGIPLRIPARYIPDCYFYEVMMQDGQLVHSDGTGAILVANGVGDTIEESLKVPYEVVDACKIPDKQYRTDLVKVLTKMHDEVKGAI